jgi:hypothetical protein
MGTEMLRCADPSLRSGLQDRFWLVNFIIGDGREVVIRARLSEGHSPRQTPDVAEAPTVAGVNLHNCVECHFYCVLLFIVMRAKRMHTLVNMKKLFVCQKRM